MNVGPLEALAEGWRVEGSVFRKRGMFMQADAAESYAAELQAALREWTQAELTLDEAVEESGYSYSSLQKKLAKGELHNIGEKGSPRVRRGDLPSKGARRTDEPDLVALIGRRSA